MFASFLQASLGMKGSRQLCMMGAVTSPKTHLQMDYLREGMHCVFVYMQEQNSNHLQRGQSIQIFTLGRNFFLQHKTFGDVFKKGVVVKGRPMSTKGEPPPQNPKRLQRGRGEMHTVHLN